MSYNQHWDRWITASILEHFKPGVNLVTPPTNIYAEGFERATDNLADWVECRVDGPFTKEQTRNNFELRFEINILLTVKLDGLQDSFRPQRILGAFQTLFNECIDCYKYGPNDPDPDDQTWFGCLCLMPGFRERVTTSNFGQVRPDTRVLQATIEGHYKINLTGT